MASAERNARGTPAAAAPARAAGDVDAIVVRSESLWSRLRSSPRVTVPGVILLLLIAMAVLAPWLTPQDPYAMHPKDALLGPSAAHLLGTDEYGRDLLARVILGSRTSLVVSFSSVALATVLGVLAGLISGYFGGIWDTLIMRSIDALLTIPPILLAIAVVAFLGPSVVNLILVIALLYMTRFARISYASVVQIKHRDFVDAARVLGAQSWYIVRRAILPNILAPIFVQISLSLGFAILLESGLSFLGLGTPPPQPSWGNMVGLGRGYMEQDGWYVFWPALAISITILCCNMIGDGLRDALDPRLKR